MATDEQKMLRSAATADHLPIVAVLDDVRAKAASGNSLIIAAPPGAGKTTTVPLVLAGEGWAVGRKIIVLEPRRLAARAAATRMASMTGTKLGDLVGLRARLDTRSRPDVRVDVVTEGVFTRMILEDPSLEGVAAVVFDEFHERSLDADLALALARDAQAGLREDLRIVLMSATLDIGAIGKALGDPPVIAAEGRMFPVETVHLGRPQPGEDIARATAQAARRALEQGGSVLVFLPGMAEIRRTENHLTEMLGSHKGVRIHALHGSLDRAEQDGAIAPAPEGVQKIVLATSIAETSLTIEGISAVVDSGLMRVPRYSQRRGMSRLETVRVTRANAEQRLGRAGRLGPGTCYRLWAEAEERGLAAHPEPEILGADLSGLRLTLAAWGVSDAGAVPWIDAPPAAALEAAETLLRQLGAIDGDNRLTPLGERMGDVGLHPRLSAMLCGAQNEPDKALAAQVAAVISEDVGGRETDLRNRLDSALKSGRVRDLASRLARSAGIKAERAARADRAGVILARGYPDRVARRRREGQGYLNVDGQGVGLAEGDKLAQHDWLVVAEAQGRGADAVVRLAAPITESDVLDLFADQVVREGSVRFDAARGRVVAEQVERLGAISLKRRPLECADEEQVATALIEGIREAGLDALPFSEAARSLTARVSFARAYDPDAGWPDLGDHWLTGHLEAWLGPFIAGKTALREITTSDVSNALAFQVPDHLMRRLGSLLPERFETPAGSSARIDYSAEGGPAVDVRVQALYGLNTHPSVLDGRVPLRLNLLSPASRPIQVTADLPAFWLGSWADVRADMRGRYPKHPWPEDPASADPTLRAKPRG
ncbi:ATP-dependent helicase HrpB [Tepidamorphus sp. 3E244]|uniref:ATP-dependent helicase HrpB n=1 Tax=Tepidamorphus sp. 3E244 TaxID=3385498 RepID=UPI0038FCF835